MENYPAALLGAVGNPERSAAQGANHKDAAEMSQNAAILRYLKENDKITAIDAMELGCWRLAARIYDLRNRGYWIKTTMRGTKGKDEYSEYRLMRKKPM